MKISVLVSTHNDEDYIGQCLQSVLDSNCDNYEIIICDDCSTDDTKKQIEKYNNYENIKCIYNKKNMGISYVRNKLIEESTGDYFIFVDGDDIISSDLLKTIQSNIHKLNTPDIIHYNIVTVENEVKKSGNCCVFDNLNGEDAFIELFVNHYNIADSMCTYAIKRDYFVKLKYKFLEGTVHEDFRITPLMVLRAKNVASINFDGYFYIKRNNSITTKRNDDYLVKRTKDMILHYQFQLSEIRKLDVNNAKAKHLFLNFISNSIITSLSKISRLNRKKTITKELLKSLKNNIHPQTFKERIKKIILYINIEIYILLICNRGK